MTEQDKNEIRKIIREEIEAKLSGRASSISKNGKEPAYKDNRAQRVVNVETVSPAY